MTGLQLENPSKPASQLEKARGLFERLADSLFGDSQVKVVITRQTVLVYFGLALGLACLLTFRRIDAVTTPQFWAEDGTLVFRNNVLLNFWDNLFTNFYGFPYLLPKLIGIFAKLFGYEPIPLIYSLTANICDGL